MIALLERIRVVRTVEERRMDLRFGVVAATLINVKRTKESDKVFSANDFFPDPDARHREMSDREIFERMKIMHAPIRGIDRESETVPSSAPEKMS